MKTCYDIGKIIQRRHFHEKSPAHRRHHCRSGSGLIALVAPIVFLLRHAKARHASFPEE